MFVGKAKGCTTHCITTISIQIPLTTLSIKMLCHYAECRVLFTIMLNVIMLSAVMLSVVMLIVVMLSVVMLNAFMLSVVAPG